VTETEVKRFEPPVTETTGPFWDATKEQRLMLQWCVACDQPIWYPREVCPRCMGSALEWRPSSGQGVVYAVTVERKPQNPGLASRAPYTVALVDLAEGVRMMSSVVGTDPEAVRIGASVQIAWEPLSDGRHLPVFELTGGA
jgi:uncharacterized OB-fold protein